MRQARSEADRAELEEAARALQSELDAVLEDRYQMQVALRAAQKELQRLSKLPPLVGEETAMHSVPRDEPHSRPFDTSPPCPVSTNDVATQTPRPLSGVRPPSANGTSDTANLARMQQLEGALRQATSDYQMLLTGICLCCG